MKTIIMPASSFSGAASTGSPKKSVWLISILTAPLKKLVSFEEFW